MKSLDTGKDKVRKICEILRQETLEPAQQEAWQVISQARAQAEEIVADARRKSEKMLLAAESELQKHKRAVQASLEQASRQVLETVKQSIEGELFDKQLSQFLHTEMQVPKVLARLIEAVIGALEKEGTAANLSAYIPAKVPARDVNAHLAAAALQKLKEGSVLLAPIAGGVQIKLHEKKLMIDISSEAVKELIGGYLRKDFRALFFAGMQK